MNSAIFIGWAVTLLASALLFRALRRFARAARAGGSEFLRRASATLGDSRAAMAAIYLVIVLCIVALAAPWLAPYGPYDQLDSVGMQGLPPSWAHPFGTDTFSRDVFSRVLYGTRISLLVAVIAVTASVGVGATYGAAAATLRGPTGNIMMRIVDALLAVPRVLILIAIAALWGELNVPALALLIGATGWLGVSRIVRARALTVNAQEYITAARAVGGSRATILARHVLPNVLSPVIVAATLGLGHVIALEAGLTYLNIGLQPEIPSWGRILREGTDQLGAIWWLWLFPGLAIVGTVMSFNTIGDGLRDAVDSRQLVRELAAEPS